MNRSARILILVVFGIVSVVVFGRFFLPSSEIPTDLASCRVPLETQIGQPISILYLRGGDADREGIVLLSSSGNKLFWHADVKISEHKWNVSCHVAGRARELSETEFELQVSTPGWLIKNF